MPSGQIATTEYSASTGGYTSSANQQSPFTPVPDDGDAVTARGRQPQPHLVDLGAAFAAIQNAWPQIGTFTGFSGVHGRSRPSVRRLVRAGGHASR